MTDSKPTPEPEIEASPGEMSFEEMIEHLSSAPFVFWRCPEHREQSVKWDFEEDWATAVCQICGKTKTIQTAV